MDFFFNQNFKNTISFNYELKNIWFYSRFCLNKGFWRDRSAVLFICRHNWPAGTAPVAAGHLWPFYWVEDHLKKPQLLKRLECLWQTANPRLLWGTDRSSKLINVKQWLCQCRWCQDCRRVRLWEGQMKRGWVWRCENGWRVRWRYGGRVRWREGENKPELETDMEDIEREMKLKKEKS